MGTKVMKFDDRGITIASRIVKHGGLIVFPTDTLYGLGCDPRDGRATERLLSAKRRSGGSPIPVLCDGFDSAEALVTLGKTARLLAHRHWPGPLTIVAPMKAELAEGIHQGTESVGVRVPDSRMCRALIRSCGGLLTGTSANVSGEPPCRTALSALRRMGDLVDLILDGGRLDGPPSTVVKVVGEKIIVLRRGKVGVKD
ncbi:MAG: threonylcarbamoyl-AMP synthase [Thaumarchaeota archaeon]|nr:threonylcarbamoyl-AMP synthase [Nitrososphaerota archaeon]